MENYQKLQLWVNLFWTKVQNFNLNFFKGIQNVSKILPLFLEQLTFCGETLLVGLIFIKITTVQPLKQPVGIVMIVMRNGWPTKVLSLISSRDQCHRFSPSQISDMPGAGLEPAQNFRLCWRKLRSSDNHYTTPWRHKYSYDVLYELSYEYLTIIRCFIWIIIQWMFYNSFQNLNLYIYFAQ